MDIQFCDNCANMLFIYLDDTKLVYKCKNCNFMKDTNENSHCVYRNDLNNKEKIQEMNIMERCKVTNAQSTIFSDINQDRALMYCVSAHFQHQSDNLAEVFVQRVES